MKSTMNELIVIDDSIEPVYVPETAEVLLTQPIARDFHEFAKTLPEYPMDFGMMRVLRDELVTLCGVSEVEAVNILHGHHLKEYVAQYQYLSEPHELVECKPAYEGLPAILKERLLPELRNCEGLMELLNTGTQVSYGSSRMEREVPTLYHRLCDLESAARAMDDLEYEYISDGERLTDEELQYLIPEHIHLRADIERAMELAVEKIARVVEMKYQRYLE